MTESNMSEYLNPDRQFEPFPEPQTMSSGWDLSNFTSPPVVKSNGKSEAMSHQNSLSMSSSHSSETHLAVEFDPFPEPRTVPANWNVSALI
jgi:hypothetical protein